MFSTYLSTRFVLVSTFVLMALSMVHMHSQAQTSKYTHIAEVLQNHPANTEDRPIFLPYNDHVAYTVTQTPRHGNVAPFYSIGANTVEFSTRYIPDSNFIGIDTAVLEVVLGAPIQTADIYYLTFIYDVRASIVTVVPEYVHVNSTAPVIIDATSNDVSTHGSVHLRDIIASSGGTAFSFGDNIWLLPNPQDQGYHYIHYLVCDDLDECKQSKIYLTIGDSTMHVDTLDMVLGTGAQVTKMLPMAGYSVQQAPNLGLVQLAAGGGAFIYDGANSAGVDAFTLVNGGHTLFVRMDVVNTVDPSVTTDDYIYVGPSDTLSFDVKSNDAGANFFVASYTQPSFGTLIQDNDGAFTYIADDQFIGVDRFEYTICAIQNCETANVYITVSDFNPEPLPSHHVTGTKNRSILINYDVPVDDYTFEIKGLATHGIVSVLVGEQSYTEGCVTSIGRFMIKYVPDTGFFGDDSFEVDYCHDGQCERVTVDVTILDQPIYDPCHCLDQCVWPGDVDHNGLVEKEDMLHLSYAMACSGASRPWAAPFSWYGQHAPDWRTPLSMVSQTNPKHADANGDGHVSINDANVINHHLGTQHGILAQKAPVVKPYSIDLEIDSDSIPTIGDTVTMYIHIGVLGQPFDDILGLGMNITFDPSTFDSSYTNVSVVDENWLNQGSYTMHQIDKQGSTFDLITSRIDQVSQAGYGRVFATETIIDDVLDGVRLQNNRWIGYIDVTDVTLIDGSGQTFVIPNQRLPFEIRIGKDDEQEVSEGALNIYPNPADNIIHVSSDLQWQEFSIFSMSGQQVHLQQMSGTSAPSIAVNHLTAGTYLLRGVDQYGKVHVSKFIKK